MDKNKLGSLKKVGNTSIFDTDFIKILNNEKKLPKKQLNM